MRLFFVETKRPIKTPDAAPRAAAFATRSPKGVRTRAVLRTTLWHLGDSLRRLLTQSNPRLPRRNGYPKEEAMSKLSLGTAILLLSSAWMVAEISAPSTDQNPTGTTQSTQQPDKSQTATSDKS